MTLEEGFPTLAQQLIKEIKIAVFLNNITLSAKFQW